MEKLDSVKYEVLYQRLHNVLIEGKEVVRKLACSPIVREAGEVAQAYILPDGELSLMSTGLLTHVNGLVSGIRYMINAHYERDIGIFDGDQFLNNDPLIGGIHRNDFLCIAPLFYKRKMVGWVGNLSHVFETGAIEPGGMVPSAEEACHEGIVLPCVKIVEKGVLQRDIMDMMTRSVRDPRPIEIDTRAKIAGNERTRTRILELIEDFGLDFYLAAARQFIEDSAIEARKIILSRRPGIYRNRCFGDALTLHEMGIRMVEVRVEFTEDGHLNISAGAISPQERGVSNCALPGLEGYTLCTLLQHLFYLARWNGGIMHPVSIEVPYGSMLNADANTPVGACPTLAAQIWQNGLTLALSQAAYAGGILKDVLGSNGIVNVCFVAGIDQFGRRGGNVLGDHWTTGGGARYNRDGTDTGVFQVNPHALGSDIETDEVTFSSINLSKKHLRDSGGYGKYRGGCSAQGVVTFDKSPLFMSSHSGYGQKVSAGQGLFGGYPPPGTRHVHIEKSNLFELAGQGKPYPTTLDEMEELLEGNKKKYSHEWIPMRRIRRGDVLGTSYWGGGGLGDPLERDPQLIVQDIKKELTTIETARKVYCVSIDAKTLSVDLEETRRLRAAKREERLREGVPAYEYLKDMVEKRERRQLPKPVLDFFDRMINFSSTFLADFEKEKEMVKRGVLLSQIEVIKPTKDLFDLTPYTKVVEDKEGKKVTQCSQCEHPYGLAVENFKLGCLIYDRDPKEIQPPKLAPDKEWMIYREFYCPGCGTQVEVEAVPPGLTILHNTELKF